MFGVGGVLTAPNATERGLWRLDPHSSPFVASGGVFLTAEQIPAGAAERADCDLRCGGAQT
jgi:hypothetical protein